MINLEETVEEVFTDLLGKSLSVEVSPKTECYVIEVISDCAFESAAMVTRGVFLGDLLREALNAQGSVRKEYLRVTGDMALFVSGIFPDSLERRTRKIAFNLGDYIDIGRVAYKHLPSDIHVELSVKFPQVVNVLNNLSVEINLTSAEISKYIKRRRQIDERVT